MSNDKWIDSAFEQAKIDADRLGPIAGTVRKFLDENSPAILDRWSSVVGRDKAIWFAKILSENDELSDLVETLTECFTVAGYLLAKMETNK